MNLLGMPTRVPVPGRIYTMHPALYDLTDRRGHPLLVTSVDPARKKAELVTRTTKKHAKGPNGVVHPAGMIPELDLLGWWRIDFPRRGVQYVAFDDESVEDLGLLDADTWDKVTAAVSRRDSGRTR